VAKDDAFAGLQLADLDFDLLEMRMAVGSRIDARNFHDGAVVEKPSTKIKLILQNKSVNRTG
jgi:hypothetical protein